MFACTTAFVCRCRPQARRSRRPAGCCPERSTVAACATAASLRAFGDLGEQAGSLPGRSSAGDTAIWRLSDPCATFSRVLRPPEGLTALSWHARWPQHLKLCTRKSCDCRAAPTVKIDPVITGLFQHLSLWTAFGYVIGCHDAGLAQVRNYRAANWEGTVTIL